MCREFYSFCRVINSVRLMVKKPPHFYVGAFTFLLLPDHCGNMCSVRLLVSLFFILLAQADLVLAQNAMCQNPQFKSARKLK